MSAYPTHPPTWLVEYSDDHCALLLDIQQVQAVVVTRHTAPDSLVYLFGGACFSVSQKAAQLVIEERKKFQQLLKEHASAVMAWRKEQDEAQQAGRSTAL